jgi:hypothetical protein
MGKIRGRLDPEYLNQLDTEVVAEMVDKLLPDVMRVKRIGRTILVFVGQPAFGPCFDGTGYDFGKYPADWLTELHGFRIRLKGVVEELNSTVRSYTIYGSDLSSSVEGLKSNCDKTLILLNLVGKKFEKEVNRAYGGYHPEDGEWGVWVEGDDDYGNECGWYRLAPDGMLEPGYGPDWDEREIEADDLFIRTCFVKWVGGIQRDILTELKSAAENAIYVEKWYELLRESISVPITTKLKWTDLTPVEKKIIGTLAKSNGVIVTSGQIALNLGMKSTEISSQLKPNAKLKANGLVETKGGTKGGSFLTEIGWSFYNTRPTGLEY